ncbi:MAG: DUF116 domain-containing protein [Firmicutes bacterium]|nr:DUF116 domain-containing protein [Bacillota bacterium]
MSVLPYSLTPGDSYYSAVEELAAEILDHTAIIFSPIIELIPVKSAEQTCLELLLLGIYARRSIETGRKPSLEHLDLVLDQLQQSKDYTYQTNILRSWQRFILGQSTSLREVIWESINDATNWFAKRSNEVLGVYTAQVNRFLGDFGACDHSEDLFCTSPMLEYHINMVGAEIFNQLWRQSFAETEQQLLVLPGCLRVDPVGCTASEWSLGYKCNHCSKGCQISELSRLGDHFGFPVSFVKHQSSFASHVQDIDKLEQRGTLGILGVACVLSLLEGGLMLEANQVPAQCVPLDFSGCKSHWHAEGLTTRVSGDRVLDLMMRG